MVSGFGEDKLGLGFAIMSEGNRFSCFILPSYNHQFPYAERSEA